MYTHCPQCSTLFRLTAGQLQAAQGQVCCGQCGMVFNALDRLVDQLPADQEKEARDTPREEAGETSAHSDDEKSPPPGPGIPASEEQFKAHPETMPEAMEDNSSLPPHEHDISEPPPLDTIEDLARESVAAGEELPEILAEEPVRPPRGPLATLGGLLLMLLLAALLAGQYAYYQRDSLARNAQVRPWLERMCHYLHCKVTPYRDLNAFELLEGDVRFHPRREEALLINAHFINQANFAQPYPLLEVTLKNISGRPVASRRFHPGEYLGENGAEGELAPHGEAALFLEVADPGLEAVSFEFNFL